MKRPDFFITLLPDHQPSLDKTANSMYNQSKKEQEMRVGELIHSLRKERKMTLLELSTRSGVALATLSRMENGKMPGTLESHMNICKALQISLPNFYRDLEASTKTVDVQTKNTRTDVFVHDKKTTSEMLSPNVINKKMMSTMIRMARGGNTHKEETKPGVEKFIYVLDGKIEVTVGEGKYKLTRGDTLYFESSQAHYFKNVGSGDSRMICVTCPPVF
jgi:quercetin dioxygenase-like cupin family protein/DNA-binding Xre family transcriptional regulator